VKRSSSILALLLILSLVLVPFPEIETVKAEGTIYIRFSSGVTIYSPLNTTYNARFLNLNLTFDQGAGLHSSLDYSIDGNYNGPIPLVAEDTSGFHIITKKTGLVALPELSDGEHCLTVNVACRLDDYHGANPPGAPFTPTSPGSSDYVATWTHRIYFKIDTSIPEFSSWTPLMIALVAVVSVTAIYRRKLYTSNKRGSTR
jgi:hypothetical protein